MNKTCPFCKRSIDEEDPNKPSTSPQSTLQNPVPITDPGDGNENPNTNGSVVISLDSLADLTQQALLARNNTPNATLIFQSRTSSPGTLGDPASYERDLTLALALSLSNDAAHPNDTL